MLEPVKNVAQVVRHAWSHCVERFWSVEREKQDMVQREINFKILGMVGWGEVSRG